LPPNCRERKTVVVDTDANAQDPTITAMTFS